MLSIVRSCALLGISGYIVDVETDISNGLPSFDIVGLPDVAVREARNRVKAAIKNSLLEFPLKRITVNLAPADIKKEGPYYDLPIALGILSATGQIKKEAIESYTIIGELSLEGRIRPVKGVLPMVISLRNMNCRNLILPIQNAEEASVITDINIYPVKSLVDTLDFLNGKRCISEFRLNRKLLNPCNNKLQLDMCEVKGQDTGKRALEIGAAGGHNVAMIGPPGAGKTMLAKRIPTILPDMTIEESIEVTKIHSVAGYTNEKKSLITERPFRAPHHSITRASLIGGGRIPKPGEISLAHFGVLFLDEMTEFSKDVLEAMRQPLEDGHIIISRVNSIIDYPANFMLVTSFNPCPCGYFGYEISGNDCKCTPAQISNYLNKISGPLFDRIDIQVELLPVAYSYLEGREISESSMSIKRRVNEARQIQADRYRNYDIYCNSQLNTSLLEKFCSLDRKCSSLLRQAFEKLGMSARAYSKILKTSRTIADLDSCEKIMVEHISEAIQYRGLDRKLRSF